MISVIDQWLFVGYSHIRQNNNLLHKNVFDFVVQYNHHRQLVPLRVVIKTLEITRVDERQGCALDVI